MKGTALTPHGAGFSFVDRFEKTGEGEGCAEKWLDPALPFFADHFPGQPLMPGVLLIEAAAQAAGILWAEIRPQEEGESTMLAQVREWKIKAPVFPGQTLRMRVKLLKDFGSLAQFEAVLSVEETEVAGGAVMLGRKAVRAGGT